MGSKIKWIKGKGSIGSVSDLVTAGVSKGAIAGVGKCDKNHLLPGEERLGNCTYDIQYLIATLKKMERNGVTEVAVSCSIHNTEPGMKLIVFRGGKDIGMVAGLRE